MKNKVVEDGTLALFFLLDCHFETWDPSKSLGVLF